jgi:hypothetical protein
MLCYLVSVMMMHLPNGNMHLASLRSSRMLGSCSVQWNSYAAAILAKLCGNAPLRQPLAAMGLADKLMALAMTNERAHRDELAHPLPTGTGTGIGDTPSMPLTEPAMARTNVGDTFDALLSMPAVVVGEGDSIGVSTILWCVTAVAAMAEEPWTHASMSELISPLLHLCTVHHSAIQRAASLAIQHLSSNPLNAPLLIFTPKLARTAQAMPAREQQTLQRNGVATMLLVCARATIAPATILSCLTTLHNLCAAAALPGSPRLKDALVRVGVLPELLQLAPSCTLVARERIVGAFLHLSLPTRHNELPKYDVNTQLATPAALAMLFHHARLPDRSASVSNDLTTSSGASSSALTSTDTIAVLGRVRALAARTIANASVVASNLSAIVLADGIAEILAMVSHAQAAVQSAGACALANLCLARVFQRQLRGYGVVACVLPLLAPVSAITSTSSLSVGAAASASRAQQDVTMSEHNRMCAAIVLGSIANEATFAEQMSAPPVVAAIWAALQPDPLPPSLAASTTSSSGSNSMDLKDGNASLDASHPIDVALELRAVLEAASVVRASPERDLTHRYLLTALADMCAVSRTALATVVTQAALLSLERVLLHAFVSYRMPLIGQLPLLLARRPAQAVTVLLTRQRAKWQAAQEADDERRKQIATAMALGQPIPTSTPLMDGHDDMNERSDYSEESTVHPDATSATLVLMTNWVTAAISDGNNNSITATSNNSSVTAARALCNRPWFVACAIHFLRAPSPLITNRALILVHALTSQIDTPRLPAMATALLPPVVDLAMASNNDDDMLLTASLLARLSVSSSCRSVLLSSRAPQCWSRWFALPASHDVLRRTMLATHNILLEPSAQSTAMTSSPYLRPLLIAAMNVNDVELNAIVLRTLANLCCNDDVTIIEVINTMGLPSLIGRFCQSRSIACRITAYQCLGHFASHPTASLPWRLVPLLHYLSQLTVPPAPYHVRPASELDPSAMSAMPTADIVMDAAGGAPSAEAWTPPGGALGSVPTVLAEVQACLYAAANWLWHKPTSRAMVTSTGASVGSNTNTLTTITTSGHIRTNSTSSTGSATDELSNQLNGVALARVVCAAGAWHVAGVDRYCALLVRNLATSFFADSFLCDWSMLESMTIAVEQRATLTITLTDEQSVDGMVARSHAIAALRAMSMVDTVALSLVTKSAIVPALAHCFATILEPSSTNTNGGTLSRPVTTSKVGMTSISRHDLDSDHPSWVEDALMLLTHLLRSPTTATIVVSRGHATLILPWLTRLISHSYTPWSARAAHTLACIAAVPSIHTQLFAPISLTSSDDGLSIAPMAALWQLMTTTTNTTPLAIASSSSMMPTKGGGVLPDDAQSAVAWALVRCIDRPASRVALLAMTKSSTSVSLPTTTSGSSNHVLDVQTLLLVLLQHESSTVRMAGYLAACSLAAAPQSILPWPDDGKDTESSISSTPISEWRHDVLQLLSQAAAHVTSDYDDKDGVARMAAVAMACITSRGTHHDTVLKHCHVLLTSLFPLLSNGHVNASRKSALISFLRNLACGPHGTNIITNHCHATWPMVATLMETLDRALLPRLMDTIAGVSVTESVALSVIDTPLVATVCRDLVVAIASGPSSSPSSISITLQLIYNWCNHHNVVITRTLMSCGIMDAVMNVCQYHSSNAKILLLSVRIMIGLLTGDDEHARVATSLLSHHYCVELVRRCLSPSDASSALMFGALRVLSLIASHGKNALPLLSMLTTADLISSMVALAAALSSMPAPRGELRYHALLANTSWLTSTSTTNDRTIAQTDAAIVVHAICAACDQPSGVTSLREADAAALPTVLPLAFQWLQSSSPQLIKTGASSLFAALANPSARQACTSELQSSLIQVMTNMMSSSDADVQSVALACLCRLVHDEHVASSLVTSGSAQRLLSIILQSSLVVTPSGPSSSPMTVQLHRQLANIVYHLSSHASMLQSLGSSSCMEVLTRVADSCDHIMDQQQLAHAITRLVLGIPTLRLEPMFSSLMRWLNAPDPLLQSLTIVSLSSPGASSTIASPIFALNGDIASRFAELAHSNAHCAALIALALSRLASHSANARWLLNPSPLLPPRSSSSTANHVIATGLSPMELAFRMLVDPVAHIRGLAASAVSSLIAMQSSQYMNGGEVLSRSIAGSEYHVNALVNALISLPCDWSWTLVSGMTHEIRAAHHHALLLLRALCDVSARPSSHTHLLQPNIMTWLLASLRRAIAALNQPVATLAVSWHHGQWHAHCWRILANIASRAIHHNDLHLNDIIWLSLQYTHAALSARPSMPIVKSSSSSPAVLSSSSSTSNGWPLADACRWATLVFSRLSSTFVGHTLSGRDDGGSNTVVVAMLCTATLISRVHISSTSATTLNDGICTQHMTTALSRMSGHANVLLPDRVVPLPHHHIATNFSHSLFPTLAPAVPLPSSSTTLAGTSAAYDDDFETSMASNTNGGDLSASDALALAATTAEDDAKRASHLALLDDETNSPYGELIVVLLSLLNQSSSNNNGNGTTPLQASSQRPSSSVRGRTSGTTFLILVNLVLKCHSITRLPDHRRLMVALFGTLRSGDTVVQVLSVTALERLLSVDANRLALASGSGIHDLASLCTSTYTPLQRSLARVFAVCLSPAGIAFPKALVNAVIIPSLSVLASSHDPFVYSLAGVAFLSMLDNKEAISVMMTRSLLVNNAPASGFHTLCYLLTIPPPHIDAPHRRPIAGFQHRPLTATNNKSNDGHDDEDEYDGTHNIGGGIVPRDGDDAKDPWAIINDTNGNPTIASSSTIVVVNEGITSRSSSRKGSRRPSIAHTGDTTSVVASTVTSRRNSSGALMIMDHSRPHSTSPIPPPLAASHVGTLGRARELAVRQHWQRRARAALASLQPMCIAVLRDISGIPVLVGSMARFGGLTLVMDLMIRQQLPLNSDSARVLHHMAAHEEGRDALLTDLGLQCVMILVNCSHAPISRQGVDCLALIVPLCIDRALLPSSHNASSSSSVPSSSMGATCDPRLLLIATFSLLRDARHHRLWSHCLWRLCGEPAYRVQLITTGQTIESVLLPFLGTTPPSTPHTASGVSSSTALVVSNTNDNALISSMTSGVKPTSSIAEIQSSVIGILAQLCAHDERLRDTLCRDAPLSLLISLSSITICQAPLSLLLRTLASFPTLRWSLALRGCLSLGLHLRSATLERSVRNHSVALLYSLLLNDRVLSSCTPQQVLELLPVMRAVAKDSRSSDTQARAASLTASLAMMAAKQVTLGNGSKALANAAIVRSNGTSITSSHE